MQRKLRLIGKMGLTLTMATMATSVCAQQSPAFPAKTLRIIVPLVPGGSTNTLARVIGDKLRDNFGQPVVVENRPGGNSVVGTEFVAKAPPDGYTLLINSSTHTIIPFVEPKIPYDTLKDFAPVATLGRTRYVMLIHPSMPAKTVKEFVALAKARPGQIDFGSSGSASGSRLAGELFNVVAGVKMQNISYKGGGQVVTDLLGGHIQVSFNSVTLSAPYVNSGRLRGLGIAGDSRHPLLPKVATFKESGLPGWNEHAWFGMYTAAAVPKLLVDRINAEIAKVQAAPDVKDQFEKLGLESFVSTSEQFGAFLKEDTAKLAKLIKAANLKFDQP